jgi:hypothetical protein
VLLTAGIGTFVYICYATPLILSAYALKVPGRVLPFQPVCY